MKQLTDEVRDAMRMAFNLGQTYWRQADSESIKQQNKSDATREQFKALMEETVATLSAATIESKQVPDLWMNLYTVAHNLLVFIGREGSVHTESSAVNSLSNAMHDIDGGTLLDEHALAAAQQAQPEPVNQVLLKALSAMLTHSGMDEDEWSKPTFDQARAAIMLATTKTQECGMCGYVGTKTDAVGQCPRCHWDELQAQPPAPGEAAITYMTGYSDGREWAGATNQAQPERAPLTDAEIEQAVKTHGVCWAGYREDKHGFYTIPILMPYHYQFARAIEAAHGIKQGDQHEKDQ